MANKINMNNILNNIMAILFTIFATSSALITYIIPSQAIRGVLAITLLLCIVISILKNKKITAYTLYLLMMAIMTLNSNYNLENKSINSFLNFLSAILVCALAYKDIDWAKKALKYMSIVYVFYSAVTIIFKFMPDFYLSNVVQLFPDRKTQLINTYNSGYMPGLTNHYSTNAMLIATGLCIEISKYMGGAEFTKKNKLIIILHIVALLLTGKRGHIIFILVAFLITYYFYKSDKNIIKRFFIVIGVVILILIIGSIAIKIFPDLGTFIYRFQAKIEQDDITSSRTRFWDLALELFSEHPILGIGWAQFQYYSETILNYKAHTHNVFLQLLCESGIVGFVIYLGWFIYSLYITIKVYKYSVKNNLKENLGLLSFSMLIQIFFLLYCITGNPLYDAEMYIPYFIGCSIAIYYYNKAKRKDINK